MTFQKNIGILDFILRLGISAGLIYVGFLDQTLISDAFSRQMIGVLGVVSLVIALARFCPLYALVGFNTCPIKGEE